MLNYVLKFKGEAKKFKIKIAQYKLHILPHNGPGFDSNVNLNILPQWRTVVSLIKNGSGILSPKIFNS